MKRHLLLGLGLLSLQACSTNPDLPTVKELDLNRYAGTWYEIVRQDNRFEKGLECITATYTVQPDGKLKVVNKGHKEDAPILTETEEGEAWVPNPEYPGRLKVQFFWPFTGDYWVIDRAPDYSYSLVGDPTRDYLWILSRTPTLPDSTYNRLLGIARDRGFAVDKLIKVRHDCPAEPS